MSEEPEVYVLVAEWASQAPIVMEVEGDGTSREAALERAGRMAKSHGFIRWCVCRLTYETGNALVLHDLGRLQPKPRAVTKQENREVEW